VSRPPCSPPAVGRRHDAEASERTQPTNLRLGHERAAAYHCALSFIPAASGLRLRVSTYPREPGYRVEDWAWQVQRMRSPGRPTKPHDDADHESGEAAGRTVGGDRVEGGGDSARRGSATRPVRRSAARRLGVGKGIGAPTNGEIPTARQVLLIGDSRVIWCRPTRAHLDLSLVARSRTR